MSEVGSAITGGFVFFMNLSSVVHSHPLLFLQLAVALLVLDLFGRAFATDLYTKRRTSLKYYDLLV
jgi:hypothetical protein